MTATIPSYAGILYSRWGTARPPSIDHYLHANEDDSSSSDEESFEQWLRDRNVSEHRNVLSSHAKKGTHSKPTRKSSTGRGRKSASESARKKQVVASPLETHNKVRRSKSFSMREVGGRRLSLFDKKEVISVEPVDLTQDQPQESVEPTVSESLLPMTSLGSDTAEENLSLQTAADTEEDHEPLPPLSGDSQVVKSRPSYLVPYDDVAADATTVAPITDIQKQLGYGSTSDDADHTLVESHKTLSSTLSAPFTSDPAVSMDIGSRVGDEDELFDASQDVSKSEVTVTKPTSLSAPKSKLASSPKGKSGRKKPYKRVCMPKKKRPLSLSSAKGPERNITPSTALADMEKMQVEVSIPRLSVKKKKVGKKSISPKKTQVKSSPDRTKDVAMNLSHRMDRVLYSPHRSKKKSALSPSHSASSGSQTSGNDMDFPSKTTNSPKSYKPPSHESSQQMDASSGSRARSLFSGVRRRRRSMKKLTVHSRSKPAAKTKISTVVSPPESFSSYDTSTAQRGLENMKESAFKVIASIQDDSVHVDNYEGGSPSRPSSSVVSQGDNSGLVDLDYSGELTYNDDPSSDSEHASGTDTQTEADESHSASLGLHKNGKVGRRKRPALPPRETKESGTDEEEPVEDFPTEIGNNIMLDGYTPITKGIPLTRSQIVKSVGGHKYQLSPAKKRALATPGVRRSNRTRVPVGKKYAYALDENVLPTVAGVVRPLEERNEVPKKRSKRVASNVVSNVRVLDHAFSDLPLNEAEAKFALATSTGDVIDVEFMKHLSVCPKKTIDGDNATKEDPLIIIPVFAMETCSIGMIVLNAGGTKPRQLTAGALIVFQLISGKIEVEIQSGDAVHQQDLQPICRFWIPEDVTYSIKNIGRSPAELVYVRLKV